MTFNHIFSNLLQQVLIACSEWIEFGTGRFVETNIRQIRKFTHESQHVNSFLVIKSISFLHCLDCWDKALVVVPA